VLGGNELGPGVEAAEAVRAGLDGERERWQPGYFPQFVVGRESLGTAALMTGMDAAYSDFRRLAEGA
jgi:hypothetical protein